VYLLTDGLLDKILISRKQLFDIMTENLFIYYRVSTKDQADKGTEENQEKSIKEFLKTRDAKILEEFKDLGLSGASSERPGFNAMISRLEEVDGIAVYDPDRLSRDYEAGLKLMFELKHKGKKLYCSRTGTVTDFSSDEDQLIHTIKSWVSEQERKKIKARQAEGIARYKENNKRWGPKVKQVNWKRYDDLRAAKVSHAAIARVLEISESTLWRRIKERKL
jgi:DNA invertase Pin-like site-specific DNA recombinase